MRDLFVAAFVLLSLPHCYRRPILGMFLFSLLAYARLQDLAWGFARYQRWSFYIAITMIAGYYSDPNRRPIIIELRTLLMIFLPLFVAFGYLFAQGPHDKQWPDVIEYAKIVGIAVFTTALVFTRDHLRIMMWLIALSFAFYGVKSGISGVLSLGSMHINTGPGGMLADNNDFALALAMSVPVILHVALAERRDILRRLPPLFIPLTIVTIMATHSRGAFLSLAVAVSVMVWRSKKRLIGVLIAGLLVVAGVAFAPRDYKERIESIQSYEEDGSAMGRLAAWKVAGEMIRANPIFGVGLARFKQNYLRYDDTPGGAYARVAHNSYLQIWAECGTPAFAVYMLLILLSVLDIWSIRRQAKRRYNSCWILNYCNMFEATIACFFVGSMFLNRAHFDLIYHYFAIVLVFGRVAREEMRQLDRAPETLVQRSGHGGLLTASSSPGFRSRPHVRAGFR